MNNGNTIFDRIDGWIRNSVSLKLLLILFLTIFLLIPAELIRHIITEREKTRQQAIDEVNAMWGENQVVTGPVLTIPVLYESMVDGKVSQVTKYLHILPEMLDINGNLDPALLKRGIYDVAVYGSEITINGSFDLSKNFNLADVLQIRFDQAFLTVGITDLRGIEEEISLRWNEKPYEVEAGSLLPSIIKSGITAYVPVSNDLSRKYDFRIDLHLQGSRNLSFCPLGNTTRVNLSSTWPSPGFNGRFLPDHRETGDNGFTASWKILQLNRNFPQFWTGSGQSPNLSDAAFGVDLIIPVDNYQKSMRSIKYAVMTIVLTFLIFFMVEILGNRKIHPFQYGLVGLALCLFYILLVSISEHMDFNAAYLISALVIITMITGYATSVFGSRTLAVFLALVLLVIYGFLYITLQLSDYALIMGSVGLTVILGLTMYFTRNIDWYALYGSYRSGARDHN